MPPRRVPVRLPRLRTKTLPEGIDWFELYRRAVVRAGKRDPIADTLDIDIRVRGKFTVVATKITTEQGAVMSGLGVSARNPYDVHRTHVGVGIALRRSLDDMFGRKSHPYQENEQ